MSFDPDILLTSAKTGYGLDTLLAKLDEVLSDRVHTLRELCIRDSFFSLGLFLVQAGQLLVAVDQLHHGDEEIGRAHV